MVLSSFKTPTKYVNEKAVEVNQIHTQVKIKQENIDRLKSSNEKLNEALADLQPSQEQILDIEQRFLKRINNPMNKFLRYY